MGGTALRAQLMRRKPVAALLDDAGPHRGGLRRALGALDLTALGIGAIIGAGIFVMTGVGARQAGPALIISFVMAGVACTMAALWYAEFAGHGFEPDDDCKVTSDSAREARRLLADLVKHGILGRKQALAGCGKTMSFPFSGI
jgi:hypothetical protein